MKKIGLNTHDDADKRSECIYDRNETLNYLFKKGRLKSLTTKELNGKQSIIMNIFLLLNYSEEQLELFRQQADTIHIQL